LSQIIEKDNKEVIADLIHVLRSEMASPEADRLRYYCGFAIEELASDHETLELVRHSREADPYWIRTNSLLD
jgi:hypothetical protein